MQSLAYIPGSNGSANASLMTVQSVRTAPATTIIVNTVAGAPAKFYATMGTPHTFTDPVTGETITVISEASAVDFAGHIDAGKVEIDAIAPGYTDLGSKVGDIIIIRPITEWANNIFNVLSQSHNDDGTIKDSAITYNESVSNHIQTGGIWALTTGLNGGMGAIVGWIDGKRGTIAAVASRAFTANRDTYVDVLRNTTTNAFSLVYTEVANGAASPALAANSLRLAKVITNGSTITSVVQQGLDSLLNLIYPSAPVQSDDLDLFILTGLIASQPTITPSIVTNQSVTLPVQSKMHKYLLLFTCEFQNGGGGAAEYFADLIQSGVSKGRCYWNANAGEYINTVTPHVVIYSKTAETILFATGRTAGTGGVATSRSMFTVLDLGAA